MAPAVIAKFEKPIETHFSNEGPRPYGPNTNQRSSGRVIFPKNDWNNPQPQPNYGSWQQQQQNAGSYQAPTNLGSWQQQPDSYQPLPRNPGAWQPDEPIIGLEPPPPLWEQLDSGSYQPPINLGSWQQPDTGSHQAPANLDLGALLQLLRKFNQDSFQPPTGTLKKINPGTTGSSGNLQGRRLERIPKIAEYEFTNDRGEKSYISFF